MQSGLQTDRTTFQCQSRRSDNSYKMRTSCQSHAANKFELLTKLNAVAGLLPGRYSKWWPARQLARMLSFVSRLLNLSVRCNADWFGVQQRRMMYCLTPLANVKNLRNLWRKVCSQLGELLFKVIGT